MNKAVFAGGCFWCMEAVFRMVKGVKNVKVGYAAGNHPFPTYEEVCTGKTGHAEAVMVYYDKNLVSFNTLLKIFFNIHDPTQLNRQGNDIGTQYRSMILYLDEKQKKFASEMIKNLKKSGKNIVTEIKKLDDFFPAEDYHQNYFKKNPEQPYCEQVIMGKINKFLKNFNEYKKDQGI